MAFFWCIEKIHGRPLQIAVHPSEHARLALIQPLFTVNYQEHRKNSDKI